LLTYAPAASAALIAGVLVLVLLVAPLRSRRRWRRRLARETVDGLSAERRERIEQYVR
jgi:hypothetical protein